MEYQALYAYMRTFITGFALLVLFKYYIYIALAPIYRVQQALWERKNKKRIKKYKPLVSIVIPARNEEVGVLTSVKSILEGSYNKVEIIVINDGSTDGTHNIVSKFLKNYKKSPIKGKVIKYIKQKNAGKGAALNTGIKKAKGEIILTMDADSAHERDAIKNLVKQFADPTIDSVVGNVKVRNNPNIVGTVQKIEYIFGFYFKRVHSIFNAEYIFGGACAGFRKSTTFDKLGLFDTENKTEDIEYSMRVKDAGLKSVYAEDVITYTEGANSLMGLYKQRLRWKKGRFDTFARYRHLFLSRDKKHIKFLSWLVLPYAVFGEILMFFEPIFITLLVTYTFISGDYLSIGIGMLFIFFSFMATFFFGDKKTNIFEIFLFPGYWMMFYVLVLIEYFSLLKSLDLIYAREDVVWQDWARKGMNININ